MDTSLYINSMIVILEVQNGRVQRRIVALRGTWLEKIRGRKERKYQLLCSSVYLVCLKGWLIEMHDVRLEVKHDVEVE
jgi:hypothetical protein